MPFHSVSLQWEEQWKLVEAQKETVATMVSTGAWESTPMFIAAMPSNPVACAAHIAVEKINGDILLVSAGDDRMWPSMRFCEIVEERLQRKGFAHSVEHVSHAGAGHALFAPYVPSVVNFTNAKTGMRTSLGGSDRANVTAMESTWNTVTRFSANDCDRERVLPTFLGIQRIGIQVVRLFNRNFLLIWHCRSPEKHERPEPSKE